MSNTLLASVAGFPEFISFFLLAIVLIALFCRFYTWITPQDELALIKENNSAAAIAFAGALIGFALPLSSAITHSLSLADCAIWGAIALIVQVLTFAVVRFTLRQLPERISKGETAAGIFSAGCSIAIGLINSACMTY
jgi:putative membrane protein